MKLFYSPGACSLSPHIVLREAGLPFTLERVDLKAHKTANGADFFAINPNGYVPALQLDEGQLLTEGPAIVQYIADRKPDSHLAPAAGSLERYQLQEWLNFISTELHKTFSPLFHPQTPDDAKKAALEKLGKRFEHVAQKLGSNAFLMGKQFSVADAYLFVMLRWASIVNVDLKRFPALGSFYERVGQRPAVKAALEAESAKA